MILLPMADLQTRSVFFEGSAVDRPVTRTFLSVNRTGFGEVRFVWLRPGPGCC